MAMRSGRGGGRGGGAPAMREQPPINILFKYMSEKRVVQVWLFENLHIRIEGVIRGFDEFMNLVLEGAVQVKTDPEQGENPRSKIGDMVLKGDNVCLVCAPERSG